MSKPLKVYCVNTDGCHERIVAASSRAEAARRMETDDANMRNYGRETTRFEYVDLAMIAPGVAWEKEHRFLTNWQPIGELAHKRVVMARFPRSIAIKQHGSWVVRRWLYEDAREDVYYDDPLGYGATELEAWSDAFRRTWLKPPAGVPTNAVTVWRFEDAPEEYRELSPHGGDEDHVAWVPPGFSEIWTKWLEPPWFGSSVSVHPIRVGEIRIGAHS